MAEATYNHDLTGVHGAENFRDLPLGVKLALADGAVSEIIANAHDGAIVLVRILEDPKNPSRVNEEETVFYTEVKGIVEDGE